MVDFFNSSCHDYPKPQFVCVDGLPRGFLSFCGQMDRTASSENRRRGGTIFIGPNMPAWQRLNKTMKHNKIAGLNILLGNWWSSSFYRLFYTLQTETRCNRDKWLKLRKTCHMKWNYQKINSCCKIRKFCEAWMLISQPQGPGEASWFFTPILGEMDGNKIYSKFLKLSARSSGQRFHFHGVWNDKGPDSPNSFSFTRQPGVVPLNLGAISERLLLEQATRASWGVDLYLRAGLLVLLFEFTLQFQPTLGILEPLAIPSMMRSSRSSSPLELF